MSLENKRIFVSGGAGVIGCELCPLLLSMGAVVMVGDLKPRPAHWGGAVIYRQGDLNLMTKSEIESFKPEIFIHLAATFERSEESYDFWEENFRNNILLSHHLMDLMKGLPSLLKVVFASSYLVYDQNLYQFGSAHEKPTRLKETDPIFPRNLTGMAKLAHEAELRFLSDFMQDSISFVVARIFRGYGKGSRCVVSRWIRSLLNSEEISVYRKEGIFDYIYAADTAKGLAKLSELQGVDGIFNLGTGKARKVSDILNVLKKYFPEMKYSEVDSGISYEASEADMTLFQKNIQWVPDTSLEEAIPEIIAYEKSAKPTAENPFNILVTSISQKIPMLKAVRKASEKLGSHIKIFGGDSDPDCLGKYFVDSFWQMPPTIELTVENILSFCSENDIKAIIPSRDGELHFWASAKNELKKNGISVMIGSTRGIQFCTDKLLFFRKLHNEGFPAIPTFLSADKIDSPMFVVKERFGAGSQMIVLNIPEDEALRYAQNLSSPVFQPFIKGKEFSADIYISKKGKPKGVVIRSRDLIKDGESQITTTVSNHGLELLCCKVVESLRLYGHVVLQILEDKDENFRIVECNARFGGASTLSIVAGLDSFYWFLLESIGNDIDEYPFIRSETEKKQIRFPEDIIINKSSP